MSNKSFRTILCVIAVFLCCAGCSSNIRSRCDLSKTLIRYNWQDYTGNGVGLWVSIERQEVALISNRQIVKRYRCSTAAAGTGNTIDSGKTPLGWHQVGSKIGDGLAAGAVLKDRQWTGQVWTKDRHSDEDLILSRILWLEGLENGINRGGNVDTKSRYIYIHGTNAVNELGQPASAGCIRLDPVEVIDLHERIQTGCRVLITD